MIKDCTQQIAQLQNIQTLQAQLDEHVGDFSDGQDFDIKEKIDRFSGFFRLRSQLKKQVKEMMIIINLERAEAAIGKENFFGPAEIKRAFNFEHDIDLSQIPEVGFTEAELKTAEELKQFLILRIDMTSDGEPLTMKKIRELKENETADGGKLFNDISWYKDEDFYTKEAPRLSWSLVTREIVDNTTNKNYLDQYDTLIAYLKNKVFKGQTIPQNLQEATKEYEDQRSNIESLIISDVQEATKAIENLKITKVFRRTPVEIIYDLVVTADGKETAAQMSPYFVYNWSARCDSTGNLVYLTNLASTGMRVSSGTFNEADSSLGVCFSRAPSINK